MNSEVIAIAHAGGKEDIDAISRIAACLAAIGRTRAVPRLEYQQNFPAAQRELAIARNIKRYAEQNMALIVILSMNFFEAVWPTASKPSILSEILNYKNNRCLHVWAPGMNLMTVARFSTALTRSVQSFRTIVQDKIDVMIADEAGNEINKLLNSVVLEDDKYTMNYPAKGVIEEAAHLREQKKTGKYTEEYEDSLHISPPPKPVVVDQKKPQSIPHVQSQPIRNQQTIHNQPRPVQAVNVHRQQAQRIPQKRDLGPRTFVGDAALEMIGFVASNNTVRDSPPVPHVSQPTSNVPQATSNVPQTTRVNNKKKNKNKSRRPAVPDAIDENELLLSEVKYFHLFELSDLLDNSVGGDYRRIAALYSFSRDDIEKLGLARLRGQRPTEQLIRGLNMRQPNLKMKDFENKCAEMQRMDVVKYIKEKVYQN